MPFNFFGKPLKPTTNKSLTESLLDSDSSDTSNSNIGNLVISEVANDLGTMAVTTAIQQSTGMSVADGSEQKENQAPTQDNCQECRLTLDRESATDALNCFQDNIKIGATIGGGVGTALGACSFCVVAAPMTYCCAPTDDRTKYAHMAKNVGAGLGLYLGGSFGATIGVLAGSATLPCAYLKGRPAVCDSYNQNITVIVEGLLIESDEESKSELPRSKHEFRLKLKKEKALNGLLCFQDNVIVGATSLGAIGTALGACTFFCVSAPITYCCAPENDRTKYARMARNLGGFLGLYAGGTIGAGFGVITGSLTAPCAYATKRPELCNSFNLFMNKKVIGLLVEDPQTLPAPPAQLMN